ncbi:hypothetical protein SPO3808 [Ruegeria pomeroyi DSS-3]|uniref:Uncharacterized protein n=2 Tax=Ruegeria pomeroyi TaxID=89184 RepID=Q5LLW3_RUEPO|nr:hypothetical protein SPO3808 [Ruegeria pomeroyi DSS-3]
MGGWAMLPELTSERFTTQTGWRVLVQVPEPDCPRVIAAVIAEDPLIWGDYDRVTFAAPGQQHFRSLPGGANTPTDDAVSVPCLELSFFLSGDAGRLDPVLHAIYRVHPYEEPVILVLPALRTNHIRGVDEGNPNRFWNRETADWVPDAHRRDVAGPPQSRGTVSRQA